MQFTEGCQPLDQEIFTGSTLQTRGYLRAGTMGVGLSPEIRTDGSETGGLSLVRIPAKECDNVSTAMSWCSVTRLQRQISSRC